MSITESEIEKLISCTEMFMNHVHYVQQTFKLIPDKKHYGTCINYIDLQEYRDEFCSELVNTISEWVYSQKKAAEIIDKMIGEGRSIQNAQSTLTTEAFKKFRNHTTDKLLIQGQFGELLLFNFLQSFFKSVPLLRKMPITTSVELERFGADAIHYKYKDNKNLFFLGEAKTYVSKYKFETAVEDAIKSILKTYDGHRKELGRYVYDSFIDDTLIEVARDYKNGMLKDVELHLVVVITYCETKKIDKKSETQIKKDIIKVIEERVKAVDKDIFKNIDTGLYPRFNYIILPIWELDLLLEEFQKLIGK
jgi:Cap4 SAVED domain